MRIVPVLDVLGGVVVRAVGGRRGEYRPLVSRLTDSTEPLTVARVLLDATGADELYVADLDAITGVTSVRSDLADRLQPSDADIWLDFGSRTIFDPAVLPRNFRLRPVIGTETSCGTGALRVAEIQHGHDRLVASVDLRDGCLLGNASGWRGQGPADILPVIQTASLFTRTVILLELAAVGSGTGLMTLGLCRRVRDQFPNLELVTGGGIHDRDDIRRAEDAGADAVLVASALHDGTLP